MPSSRAVVVLGRGRSGTSVLTRGLQALGVFLGDNFIDPQPSNPTGFWEDWVINHLNKRLLGLLGLDWKSISLIGDDQWQRPDVQALRAEAADYLQACFMSHSLWGFKDPRTIRLLPFWRAVFQRLGVDDQYVVAIRNPLSMATSLLKSSGIEPATSHKLFLVYLVPYLHEIAERPFVVVDYDLLVAEPQEQLARVRRALNIPFRDTDVAEIERFSTGFLDPNLRHGYFSPDDLDTNPEISPLIREAYFWLYQLATDQLPADSSAFWTAWKRLRGAVQMLITSNPSVSGGKTGQQGWSLSKLMRRFRGRP